MGYYAHLGRLTLPPLCPLGLEDHVSVALGLGRRIDKMLRKREF
jgi:hypothetical protein